MIMFFVDKLKNFIFDILSSIINGNIFVHDSNSRRQIVKTMYYFELIA